MNRDNPLIEDFKRSLIPEILIVRDSDFTSEEEMQAYIRKNPAKRVIIVQRVDGRADSDENRSERASP